MDIAHQVADIRHSVVHRLTFVRRSLLFSRIPYPPQGFRDHAWRCSPLLPRLLSFSLFTAAFNMTWWYSRYGSINLSVMFDPLVVMILCLVGLHESFSIYWFCVLIIAGPSTIRKTCPIIRTPEILTDLRDWISLRRIAVSRYSRIIAQSRMFSGLLIPTRCWCVLSYRD